MVFSSTIFIFVFLPVTFLIYFLSKDKFRNVILLIASLLFYACGEPRFVFIMMASIVINYWLALLIEKKPIHKVKILCVSIFSNLIILFIFKYLGFFLNTTNLIFHHNLGKVQIMLPIGISFFTFQIMSYVIDVYSGKAEAQHNILNLGLYVSFFPQLIAGPIVRYSTIANQISKREENWEKICLGTKRFMCGLFKKVLLANNLAVVAEYYFAMEPDRISVIGAWLGSICFSLQIYYDFAGYSDMAIGLASIFGFQLEENFNYPYISKTISEFWRRWHISLSKWFRDYVYIPLGGSRRGVLRHIFNLGVVWILTGIWHGANYTFILWGILYFAALVLEKYAIKPENRKSLFRFFYMTFTLLYANFCWVFFNASGIRKGIGYCLAMLGFFYHNAWCDLQTIGLLREYSLFLLAGCVLATPIVPRIGNCIKGKIVILRTYLLPIAYMLFFLWTVSFLILGAHNPFIYFNF